VGDFLHRPGVVILSENNNHTLFSIRPSPRAVVNEEKPEPQPNREENPWFIPENIYDFRLFAPEMDPKVYRNFDYNKANKPNNPNEKPGAWWPEFTWATYNLMYWSIALGSSSESFFAGHLDKAVFNVFSRLIIWCGIVVVRQWWRWLRRRH
jgi:hypothetical protein